MADQVLKVLAEGPIFSSLMSLVVMKGAVFFRSRKGRIIWYWLWALDPGLILDSLEDVLDREIKQSGVLTHLEGFERIRRRVWERLLLVGALPPASVPGGWASLLWLRFFSLATLQERLVVGSIVTSFRWRYF